MVLFAILHYLYYLCPNPFFQIISGIDESVFQHLKMGFIAYLLLIGIDYLIIRKRVENKQSFVFSRLMSSLLVPWIIFIVWYLVPAFVGHEIGFGRELAWALVVVFLTEVTVSLIDENTEKFEYILEIKIVIGVLVVISLVIFIWFSFDLPWIDVFILPE